MYECFNILERISFLFLYLSLIDYFSLLFCLDIMLLVFFFYNSQFCRFSIFIFQHEIKFSRIFCTIHSFFTLVQTMFLFFNFGACFYGKILLNWLSRRSFICWKHFYYWIQWAKRNYIYYYWIYKINIKMIKNISNMYRKLKYFILIFILYFLISLWPIKI